MSQNMRVGSWVQAILFGMAIVLSLAHSTSAQQTKPTAIKPVITSTTPTPTTPVIDSRKRLTPPPVEASPNPNPNPSPSLIPPTTTGKTSTVAKPLIPPPPPPPPLPAALRETPNNPLAPPQNMDDLLKLQMTTDIWAAMYSPLSCLDAFVTS